MQQPATMFQALSFFWEVQAGDDIPSDWLPDQRRYGPANGAQRERQQINPAENTAPLESRVLDNESTLHPLRQRCPTGRKQDGHIEDCSRPLDRLFPCLPDRHHTSLETLRIGQIHSYHALSAMQVISKTKTMRQVWIL